MFAGAEPDVMRTWGVAEESRVADTERLNPGTLIAARYAGETESRGDLLYNGAEPAASFLASNARAPIWVAGTGQSAPGST